MTRRFNITGSCSLQRHYMVSLDNRLRSIKQNYVEDGNHFVINKGRQYGKTTTLRALEEYLKEDYVVLSLDFQEVSTQSFANEVIFSHAFAKKLSKAFGFAKTADKENMKKMLSAFREEHPDGGLDELFECLSTICAQSSKPIVLMIDEVDSASNNQVFIDLVAGEIYAYTSGYPVLVSMICKRIDEKIAGSAEEKDLGGAWSPKGVEKAVLMILKENPVLFESMAKQLNTYAGLHEIIESIIYHRVCCCKICR